MVRYLRNTLLFALLLALLVGGGVPSASASKADEAEVQFRLGNKAFLARKYEHALGHYFASLRLAKNRNVLFNVARCYEAQKRYVEAYRYYLDYRRGGGLPESELKGLNAAIARISDKVAVIAIRSDPDGAKIFLNRKDLGSYGESPRLLPVQPGRYTVFLEHKNYQPASKTGIEAVAGRTVPVHFDMKRLRGTAVVKGTPEGAEVTLWNRSHTFKGQLPFSQKVPAALYSVRVDHPNFDEARGEIQVIPDTAKALELHLSRSLGSMVVQADEPGALILIDGQARGFTPAVLEDVPTGLRSLEVRLRGFATFRSRVEVKAQKRATVKVILRADDSISAASGRRERVEDAPASVSVIYATELSAHGDQTLSETLSGLRGVFLTNDKTYAFAGIRGLMRPGSYGQRLMVQLDGHTLNDDWLNGSYISHDLLVGLHGLNRVELVRGPLSALYGTGAFYGVVNLVTPDSVEALEVQAGTAMAGFNTFKAYGRVAVPLGDTEDDAGFWLYGGGVGRQPGDYFSPARGQLAAGVTGMRGGSVLLKGKWRDLTVSGYFNQRRQQIPTASFETIFGDKRSFSEDRRAFAEIRYQPRISDTARLKLRLHYDHYGYMGAYPYEPPEGVGEERYGSHWAGVELVGQFSPTSWASVDAGGGYNLHLNAKVFGGDDEGPYIDLGLTHHEFSLFVLSRLQFMPEFGVFAGVRFDGFFYEGLVQGNGSRQERFFWTINPNLSIIARPWRDGILKCFFGRGFRAPSAYELSYNDGGRTQKPSPDLVPEEVYSGEIEYRHRLPLDLWLSASVFVNATEQLVEISEISDGQSSEPFLKFINRREALWTLGAEFEFGKTLRRGVQFNVFYAYQHTRSGEPVRGGRITNSPEHIVGARAIVPIIRRSLRLATRLGVETGRLTRDGGTTEPVVKWDLTLSGELPVAQLRYAVGVRNLLDWQVRHPVGDDVEDITVLQNGVELMIDLSVSL